MTESNQPLLVIVLMIKNEESSIEETLSCLFQGGISHYIILDTGSEDKTVQLTQDFIHHHQLNGYVIEEPFVDFSTSRNRALTLAKQHFPDATFFLMPDAEWYLRNPRALLKFCEQEKNTDTALYSIKAKMSSLEFYVARLFRASQHILFKGLVHESPDFYTNSKVPNSVYFDILPTPKGIEASKKRWQNDCKILLKAYQNNPDDSRQVFYLAQTYECLGELEKAYLFYQERAKLTGWDEENYMTLYRLGCLALKLNQTSGIYTWSTAMNYFLQAFSLRPHRIEPLIQIADYYWPSQIPTCYLFAQYAYNIPFPIDDKLFIETEFYRYTRYEIMSRCAWHMGNFELGEMATKQALEVYPNVEHLLKNLALYQEKLRTIQTERYESS